LQSLFAINCVSASSWQFHFAFESAASIANSPPPSASTNSGQWTLAANPVAQMD
jgi:hypothetical protein